jgi:hypothetical protein
MWLDRALAAYPLVIAYLVLLILTAWQTTKHATPWNFTDELKWAELSRSVAHTGHPQLRLHDAPADSLYTYFLAPAWWFGSTETSYAAAKYLNAAVVTATIFPVYGLARLFVLRRPVAIGAAICAAAIPAVSYAGMLIPEPLAYFWSTLTLWLLALAMLRPARRTIAAAVLAVVIAPFVRSQLAVLAPAAVLAAAVYAATSERARAIRRGWSAGDYAGSVLLLVGAGIWAHVVLAHHSYTWAIGTHFGHRMLEYGLWAVGAFAIGVGVVPVAVALAWALSAHAGSREDRVLLGVLLGSVVCFGLYTAVKASYISTNFAIRVEERNLIYLAPLVLVVTGRWLEQGRARLTAVAAAVAGMWYLLDTTPYHMDEHFSVDAPGLAILSWLNRTWAWTPTDARRLLLGTLVLTAVVLCVREILARRAAALGRWRLPATALVVLLLAAVGAWNVTGQVTAANASNAFAKDFLGPLPKPPDFVDRVTGGERTLFIGQQLGNSNMFWSLEFWNRSIADVWSTDASAPPPGPTTTPNIDEPDGTTGPQLPVKWAVTGDDVGVVGRTVTTNRGLHVVRVTPPLRIAHEVGGVTPDGWMGDHSWFIQFSGEPGVATVSLSRSAACGDVPPARLDVRVGDVAINENRQPTLGRVRETRRVVVRSTPCESKAVRIHATPPFRIDVSATAGLFQPSKYDQRNLSATIAYSFAPGR